MADFSDADRVYAEGIIGNLMTGETQGVELEPGLAVVDIEQNALQFAEEMSVLEKFNLPCPAIPVDGVSVPAALEAVQFPTETWLPGMRLGRGWSRYWLRNSFAGEAFVDAFRYWSTQSEMGDVSTMPRDEAREAFQKRALDFLANRVAAVRSWRNHEDRHPWQGLAILNLRPRAKAAPAPTPGCHFTVSTNSGGLRVFWSGAYYVSPNNFNSPTTPTTSVLQSGVYIFGVDGGAYGNTIQWDQNNVVTLPGHPHYTHLNY